MNKDSKQIIDNWLSRIDSQEIVVVIGAGFTRNALLESLNTSAASRIPLWNDLILSIQEKMNLFSFDSLLSFDIYREFYGRHNYEKLLLDSIITLVQNGYRSFHIIVCRMEVLIL